MLTNIAQRWNGGRAFYRPVGEPINTSRYEVAEIEDDLTAKVFVEQEHYSHSYPAARRRFGLYLGSKLVGVAVFSHPSNDRVITSVFVGTRATDSVELGRFVLLDDVGANAESWFFARCRERLRPDFLGIVSFADDVARFDNKGSAVFGGHLGIFYAASNGIYIGRGTPRTLRLLPDGRTMSDRTISKIRNGERGWRYASETLVSFGATPVPEEDVARREWLKRWLKILTRPLRHPGNHKYCWSLDRRYKLPESLPYPKVKYTSLPLCAELDN